MNLINEIVFVFMRGIDDAFNMCYPIALHYLLWLPDPLHRGAEYVKYTCFFIKF